MQLWTSNDDDKVYRNLSQLSKALEAVSLCIWGWPRLHLHNGWHQGMYCHFWLDPGWARPFWECACVTQIKWRYHAQWAELGVFDLGRATLSWRNIVMLMRDLYSIWISFISNKHPVDISTQGTSCLSPLAAYQWSWLPKLSQLNLL